MTRTHTFEDFLVFMEEYTEFLERMVEDENEKLAALQSRDLPRIEHSITTSQANAKQLENHEKKRLVIQQHIGMENLSFREIIEQAPAEQRSWLGMLFSRFENTVREIRFRNDKSMAVARDNMMDIDPEAALPTAPAPRQASAYKRIRDEQRGQSAMLETKV